jgi:hypothetical protein
VLVDVDLAIDINIKNAFSLSHHLPCIIADNILAHFNASLFAEATL